MIYLKLFLVLFFITFITFIYRYSQAKENYKEITKLKEEFISWIQDTDLPKPSNAVFTRLYHQMYGTKERSMRQYKGNSALLVSENIDVVGSFPTMNSQVRSQILFILDNMESHYFDKLIELKKKSYWIKFIIFIPSEISSYLGIKTESIFSKIMIFLYWLIPIIIGVFNSDIRDFFIDIFKV